MRGAQQQRDRPASLDELRAAVSRAAGGRRAKVFGTGHSWSEATRGDDLWMSPAHGRASCFIGLMIADGGPPPGAGVRRLRGADEGPRWPAALG